MSHTSAVHIAVECAHSLDVLVCSFLKTLLSHYNTHYNHRIHRKVHLLSISLQHYNSILFMLIACFTFTSITISLLFGFLALILSIHPLRFILQFHFHTPDYPSPIIHTPLYNPYSVEVPKTATESEIHRTVSILIKTNTPH